MVDHLSKNPSKSRILIVEDDKSIRETLREALVAEGYAVEVCKTGDEAQTRIFSQLPISNFPSSLSSPVKLVVDFNFISYVE